MPKPKKQTPAKPAVEKPNPPIIAPKVITAEGEAQVVINTLAQIQTQRLELQVQQVANAAADDDVVPQYADLPDGPMTYQDKYDQFGAAEERICKAYADVVPTIVQMVEDHRKQAEERKKAADEAEKEEEK